MARLSVAVVKNTVFPNPAAATKSTFPSVARLTV